jgi:hypothetical protein
MDKYSEALENSSVVEVENWTKTQLKTETQIRNEKNYELDNESGEFGLEWKKPLEEIKIESFDDFKRFMDKVWGLKNKVVNTRKAEFEKLVKEKINLYLEWNFSSLRNLGKIKKIFGLIIDGIKGFEWREVEKFGKDLKEVKQIFDRNDIGKQLGRLREFWLEVVRLENWGIRVDAIKLKLPVK